MTFNGLSRILFLLLAILVTFKVEAFKARLNLSCCTRSFATGIETRVAQQHFLFLQENDEVVLGDLKDADIQSKTAEATLKLTIPLSLDDMVSMASKAICDSSEAGITRQIVRVLLPRNPSSQQLGQFFESDAYSNNDLVLVPPDETWQGGIMQLYRAALPTCTQIIRRLSRNIGGLPPKIKEDRSVDESGVDGVGLLVAESSFPQDNLFCFIQPLQETIGKIERLSNENKEQMVILINPQWKNIDDALDTVSMTGGLLGGFFSMLGGKGNSVKRLQDLNFESVFTVEGYICKGGNVRLIKRFDSDWAVFAENDDSNAYIRLGTSKSRPTYQEVDQMMNNMGIKSKYARDIGFAPKL